MQREAMLRIDNETELRVNEMHEMVSPERCIPNSGGGYTEKEAKASSLLYWGWCTGSRKHKIEERLQSVLMVYSDTMQASPRYVHSISVLYELCDLFLVHVRPRYIVFHKLASNNHRTQI